MTLSRIVAVLLIALGTAGLIYREFSYTKKTHEGAIAGLEFSVKEQETVEIPVWGSAGLIAVGAGLLLFGLRKSS